MKKKIEQQKEIFEYLQKQIFNKINFRNRSMKNKNLPITITARKSPGDKNWAAKWLELIRNYRAKVKYKEG